MKSTVKSYKRVTSVLGYPSFYETVTRSRQWKAWKFEQSKRYSKAQKTKNWVGIYDMPEVEECGWISQDHFQDFLSFSKGIK